MTFRIEGCTAKTLGVHSQTPGNKLENRSPTNGGQHSCRRSGETYFLCLPSSSFCHRRKRKTDLHILPSPSLWLDLTTTKRRRDRRKLFHDGGIISTLMSPPGKPNLHVVKSMKLLALVSPPSSTDPPWRRRMHPTPLLSPERRRRK